MRAARNRSPDVARKKILGLLYNKQMWGLFALCFGFASVSGQMWNKMKDPLLFGVARDGPVYISSRLHKQFVYESYIVAILNGIVVWGMILMIEAAGGINEVRSPPRRNWRRCQSVIGLVLICVFFSLLLSLFRKKLRSYPYSFLFK